MTSEGYQCEEISKLADMFWMDHSKAALWLESLKSCLGKMKTVHANITNMVVSLFLMSNSSDLSNLALQTIVDISKQDVSQVCYYIYPQA